MSEQKRNRIGISQPGGRRIVGNASMLLALTLVLGLAPVQAQAPSEYGVKAAVISRLPSFVEWPASPGLDANLPLVIGILGEDPFGAEIDSAINGKTTNSRPLIVKRFPTLKTLTYCHILFISSSERKNLRRILAAAGPGVLTVGETDHFAEDGGMINFRLEGSKLQFDINQRAANKAGLRLSAKLLHLARTVWQ